MRHLFLPRWAPCLLALSLLTSSVFAPVAVHAALPSLGDGGDMSLSAEKALGEQIAREIYRDADYLEDPILDEYIQTIWQPLRAAAKARGDLSPELDERFAWKVLLVRDHTVNAFALPGAYCGVHLGLIATVSNRDELASVLGHEMSHVTQRHIARLIAQQSQQAPLMMGALILGALAAGSNAEAANAAIVGGQALAIQNQLNFSRDMEREADRVGYGVMEQAGFNPTGFVTMFSKLQKANLMNDNGAYPYLRSHPLTTQRIAEAQNRLDNDPHARAQASGDEWVHPLMAARARILIEPGVDALRTLARDPQSGAFGQQTVPRQAGTLYAAALASARLQDWNSAARYGQQLQNLVSQDAAAARISQLLRIEIALAQGQAAREVASLPPARQGRPELFLRAQVELQTGQALGSIDQLETRVAVNPKDSAAWQMLGSLYQARGMALRAVRAQAEAQVAHFDYAGALDRLKAAQDILRRQATPGDHIDASIIDTRTREVQALLREQALQDRVNR